MTKRYHVADLTPQGEVRSVQEYDYATLALLPGCVDLIAACSGALYRSPESVDLPLGRDDDEGLALRWRASAPTAGILTIRAPDRLASVSILASGIRHEDDTITLQAFQRHLTQSLHDTGFEPAFGLVELRERPLVATVTFHSPKSETGRMIVALADRCFAASFFRYHGLA
jgi:hypothetical protein